MTFTIAGQTDLRDAADVAAEGGETIASPVLSQGQMRPAQPVQAANPNLLHLDLGGGLDIDLSRYAGQVVRVGVAAGEATVGPGGTHCADIHVPADTGALYGGDGDLIDLSVSPLNIVNYRMESDNG